VTVDASDLDGLDPYAALDAEAFRIDAFLSELADDDADWNAPTACEAWNRRDMLGHLASAEEYHHACFADELDQLFGRLLDAGATNLHAMNDLGIRERADRSATDVLREWREADARTRELFRERGAEDMATSVGAYPARWQAFHVASELATHADDMGVPVPPNEVEARLAWRTAFSRFSLMESKPDLSAEAADGGTRITGDGLDVLLDDPMLVAAVAGRLPPEAPLDDAVRTRLSTAP
jgi:uncharacterized protein (TIGR03083 family)